MSVIDRKKANHQFGFRSKYAIVEHIHRITNEITLAFEAEKYCSVFLNISQAFDKVWHDDLKSNNIQISCYTQKLF